MAKRRGHTAREADPSCETTAGPLPAWTCSLVHTLRFRPAHALGNRRLDRRELSDQRHRKSGGFEGLHVDHEAFPWNEGSAIHDRDGIASTVRRSHPKRAMAKKNNKIRDKPRTGLASAKQAFVERLIDRSGGMCGKEYIVMGEERLAGF